VTRSVLVVSSEPVGARMAGPAIRAAELARALAAQCDVTLAAPAPSEAPGARVRLVEAGMADVEALVAAAREHDVVVAQELPLSALGRIAVTPTALVVDLYNPIVVEVLEAVAGRSPRAARRTQAALVHRTAALCAAADLIVCANERQRDLWIGGLALAGLIDLEAYRRDPTLRSLIAVVPFGLPNDPPPADGGGQLRAAFPQIGEDDRVLVWGGGLWSWLDPVTPMRAVGLLEHAGGVGGRSVHLVLMGAGRPGLQATGQGPAVERALAEARRLGVEGRLVHVNSGWVPYEERGAWLAGADVGVSAHHDHLEARYAHRTRILDYLWAGLPVATTAGDALADLVEREGLGRTVAPGDAEGFAAACADLLGAAGGPARERIAGVAPSLRWDRVAAPLVEWCASEQPRRAIRRGALRRATLAQQRWALEDTLAEEGALAAARRLARRLRRVRTLR
jgi:glycosyltransferase involved in cell wall biosynthesis